MVGKVKRFTPEEIDHGIEKLRRRMEEVKRLEQEHVKYNDQIVKNVQRDIRVTIMEVFGEESPEFETHQSHRIWHGGFNLRNSEGIRQKKFENGIPQTSVMLGGLISRLEEKRKDIESDAIMRTQAAFRGLTLHPRIGDVSTDLYLDGHYSDAIFNASKALINYVKEKSRRHDLDGAPLMRQVFSKNNPIVAFNDLKDRNDFDEQEGMMHLFEGAVLAIRNPRGHSFIADSPDRALEYIAFLSMLANRLDEARRLE